MVRDHRSTPSTGWIIELAGASIDSSVYLAISKAGRRFGWTRQAGEALMLAREVDAEALAGYARARAKAGTTVAPRSVEWDRPNSDLEQENLRLRTRISDLESILSALRRIRANDIARAEEESQSGNGR